MEELYGKKKVFGGKRYSLFSRRKYYFSEGTESELADLVRLSQKNKKKKNDVAVILHLYYPDLWPEMKSYISNLGGKADLFISLAKNFPIQLLKEIERDHPEVCFFAYENRGRDILPFLKVFKEIKDFGYLYICKIHSKKSPHMRYGSLWRNTLLFSLLGSPERILLVKDIFERDEGVGIIMPKNANLCYKDFIGFNENMVISKLKELGLNFDHEFNFPSGSMFWFRPAALFPLLDLNLADIDFEDEKGQLDGTLAHAVERLFCVVLKKSGYKTEILKEKTND
jgi:lipopolysaccharide biosynthesis protein